MNKSAARPFRMRLIAHLMVSLTAVTPVANAATYDITYAGFALAASAQSAARMAASVLATETVDDVDGYPLPPAMLSGTGAPTGGGFIPTASNSPKLDGTAARLGYCAWDNGTSTAAVGRIAGSNSLGAPAIAIIAPGLDGAFNTTCADILAGVGTAGNGAKVDDFVVSYSTAQLRNLYSLHVGPAVADTTALNAIAPSSLRDGEVRLVKADNTLRRWDSGSSSWKSAGSSGLSPDAGGNLKAGTNAFVLATVATTDTGTDGAIQNILFGKEAGRYLNGAPGGWASHNLGIGYQALRGDTAGLGVPTYSIAIGYRAMGSVSNVQNTGSDNIAIGRDAIALSVGTVSGGNNIGLGAYALASVDAGFNNVAVGSGALDSVTSGYGNSALGYGALSGGAASNYNIGIGVSAGALSSASNNIAIGYQALTGGATGGNNVAMGYRAGLSLTSGTYNTLLGSSANVSSGALTYATAIGAGSSVGTSNTVVLGRVTDTTVIGNLSAVSANALLQVNGGLYLAPRAQPATNLVAGVINFNSADNTLYYYNGTAWVAAGGGGGGWSPDVNGNLKAGTGAYSSGTTGTNNIALGANALASNTTQSYSVGIGYGAGQYIRPAGAVPANIAIGYQALNGQSATPATSVAAGNVAIGYQAMQGSAGTALTGANNIAIGSLALTSVTSGTTNVAIGYASMQSVTTGSHNIGLGQSTLVAVSGSYNVGLAYMALLNTTSGSSNFAAGNEAARYNTTGSNNFAVGYRALYYNQTGNNNVVIGYGAQSGGNSYSVANNVAIGYNALAANRADEHIAIGPYAQARMYSGVAGTPGTGNISMGPYSLYGGAAFGTGNNGTNNIALGYQSMMGTTGSALTGTDNFAAGNQALKAITGGAYNIAIGRSALLATTTGSDNQALGNSALTSNTSGAGNIGLGGSSLLSNNTGNYNTAVGMLSGYTSVPGNANTSGSYNTFIGYDSGPGVATQLSYATALGAGSRVTSNNTVVLGRTTDKTVIGATAAATANASLQVTGGLYLAPRGNPNTNLVAGLINFDSTANAPAFYNGTQWVSMATQWREDAVKTNLAVGGQALVSNTFGAYNIAIGQDALSANTGGESNVAMGSFAMQQNTVGGNGTAIGASALKNNVGGWDNTAVGALAMYSATNTDSSSAFGAYALHSMTTGVDNSAHGKNALYGLTTGSSNTAMGREAASSLTTGSNNLLLGWMAGDGLIDGSFNTLIGSHAVTSTGSLNYATALGADAAVSTSNTIVLGRSTDITVIGATGADTANAGYGLLQVSGHITPGADNSYNLGSSLRRWSNVYAANGTIQTSDIRTKTNIASIQGDDAIRIIQKMNPIRYNWVNPRDGVARKVGFVAQELAQILPEVVHIPSFGSDLYGVNYAEITAILAAAVKKHQEAIGLMAVKKDAKGGASLAVNGMLEADVILARAIEAESIKVKTLEAESIKAKKVLSGETVVTTGAGCTPIFTMDAGAVYDVRVMSAQGGWGSMRIGLSEAGPSVQDRKMSDNGFGIELNVIGNQVCALSAIGQRASAGWLRVL